MKQINRIIFTIGSAVLIACGGSGGGGGSSSACTSLKINGGESCEEGGSPVAAVLPVAQNNETGTCTGTLISSTAVLTAAHCVYTRPKGIVVGVAGHVRTASQYIIHPRYRGVSYGGFDLAVVKFIDPIPVAPAPLLVSKGAPAQGEQVVAYGVGTDEQGDLFLDRLRSGDIPLKATYLTFAGVNNTIFYETISDGGGNTCKGDSGGPILARNASGQWGIVAVTSFSPNVSDERPCIPVSGGTLAVQSTTQTNEAMNFIFSVAPDAAIN
jgi:hypothetical protein